MSNKDIAKYKKIAESDVVKTVIQTAEDWRGCGIISPSNIASLLNTSRYQVNKHIRSLKSKGLLEYKSVYSEGEELYPPYNGYCLSNKGRWVYRKQLEEKEQREIEAINKCMN